MDMSLLQQNLQGRSGWSIFYQVPGSLLQKEREKRKIQRERKKKNPIFFRK